MTAIATSASALPLDVYDDSLSTDPPAPDQIDGTGWWDGGDPEGPYQATTLGWAIADLGTHVHYTYTFTHPEHDTSYFILEVSDDFLIGDILQVYGDLTLANVEVGTYVDTGSINQGMPGTVYGVKFDAFSSYTDNGDGTITETIEFDSTRLPVWGDFFARCGIHPTEPAGHGEWDAAWNVGFLSGEVTRANDVNDGFHAAVPNGIVPEPNTFLLLASGLLALGAARRRR